MKKAILSLLASLGLLASLPASADLPGDWSSAVTITAINMGGTGEFTIVTTTAPNPGGCNNVYRVYLNATMGITTSFGLEMLHKQAVAALVSGKKASIFRSNDASCFVGFIYLTSD